jgi:protein-disulfide isomerase-like protein with CxxC motif
MQRFGANGVPALIVAGGTAPRLLGATALFTRVEDLVARLHAMRAQPRTVS